MILWPPVYSQVVSMKISPEISILSFLVLFSVCALFSSSFWQCPLMRFGWVTEQSSSFFTLCIVWLTGMWLVNFLPIETIALPFHLQKYKYTKIYHHSGNQMFLGLIFAGSLYPWKPSMLPVGSFLEQFQLLLHLSYQGHLKGHN